MKNRVFKRKIYSQMAEWKEISKGSTALLVEGARRIGKSTIVEEFAKNEYESFIIVVNPESEMENFRISVADFTSSDGKTIPGDQVEIRKVEYVKVSHPTDYYV